MNAVDLYSITRELILARKDAKEKLSLKGFNFPEGDFDWTVDEEENLRPVYCDNCQTWHQQGTAFNAKRTDGVLTLSMDNVDTDGNWESFVSYDSSEDSDQELADCLETMSDIPYFDALSELEYYFWIFLNHSDPANVFYTHPTTKEGWEELALKNIKALRNSYILEYT